jgi:phenylacetate-CoA ligase
MKEVLFPIIDRFRIGMLPYYNFYMKSQYWSRDELANFQLSSLVQLSNSYLNLSIKDWDDFYSLPLTSKDDIRKPIPKVQDATKVRSTSGSTGRPLMFYASEKRKGVLPAILQRAWNWVGRTDELVLRLTTGDPEWAWYDSFRNVKPMNYRTISSKYLDFIVEKVPYIIHGQGGAIREITSLLLASGHEDVMRRIKLYLMSEDPKIHKQFLKPLYAGVYSGYGLSELCTVASECEFGNLHVNMETAIVEIIDGEIVVTDPFNNVIPILRYKTGDLGKLRKSDCPCKRAHDILYDVEGKQVDYYDGKELKRPIAWWVVSPISHQYYDVVKQWRLEVFPAQRKAVMYVTWKDPKKTSTFDSYREFLYKNNGLSLQVESVETVPDWGHKKLVKVTV